MSGVKPLTCADPGLGIAPDPSCDRIAVDLEVHQVSSDACAWHGRQCCCAAPLMSANVGVAGGGLAMVGVGVGVTEPFWPPMEALMITLPVPDPAGGTISMPPGFPNPASMPA